MEHILLFPSVNQSITTKVTLVGRVFFVLNFIFIYLFMHLTSYTEIENNNNKTNKNTGDWAPCDLKSNAEVLALRMCLLFLFNFVGMLYVFGLLTGYCTYCVCGCGYIVTCTLLPTSTYALIDMSLSANTVLLSTAMKLL